MNIPEATTPLMRQYQAAKKQVPGTLLLFRLGDFYELFYEDAVIAARELEITLTARNKEKGEPGADVRRTPPCGGRVYLAVDTARISGGRFASRWKKRGRAKS